MQSQCAIFDHSNVIQPSPHTGEHKASIGKREMSLTMCGCFQLTSEACYKYSDAAHCAPLAQGNTNKCNHESRLNLNILEYTRATCVRVTQAGLHYWMNVCPYLIITIFVAVVAGRNFSDGSHISREGTIVFGALLTDWMTDLQWDDHTNSVMSPNKISMVTVAQAARKPFIPSGTVNPAPLTIIILSLIPAWRAPVNSH